jgi:hypothetical protein
MHSSQRTGGMVVMAEDELEHHLPG